MGVKNLWEILDSCKKKLPLHSLQNKRVCIDLSCWMVQLQNVSKSHSCMKEKVYLKGLFHRIRALIALNCSLIFVTDGSIPAIKLQTYRRRLNSGADTVPLNDSTKTVSSLRRNMGSEFSCMIKEAKLLGSALGIPCLDGIEEAEAQCALLNYESLCDGCFTSDSDVFLFGARTVYRDICLGDGGYVICYEMEDIERNLGFGRNSLITLGLLLGSDYTEGVYGLGRESACQIVKSIGDNSVLKKISSEELFLTNKKKDAKNKIRNLKCSNKENICEPEMNSINGCYNTLKSNERFLHLIDAYLKPRCHQADSDAVQRVLVQHSFQRIKFQQICARLFGWPPEKTDEYILPKIAEKNLRQFANLRLTSSTLGLNLALPQIPVACPLSEIIKPRKVQGRECYEVAWKDMDGLKSSIVPSDLLESACPEKIVEFKERAARGKKPNRQNRSHKQLANKFPMEELDLKLKSLLLDVEQGDNVFRNAPCPLKFMAEKENVSTKASLQNQKLSPYSGTKVQDYTSKFVIAKNEQCSSYSKTEVIDLLSPSPQKNTCSFSKFKRSEIEVVKTVEVIHLSDSEAEASPKHQRRLRELRSFITSMKNDI